MCTGIAVIGGRFLAMKISVKKGRRVCLYLELFQSPSSAVFFSSFFPSLLSYPLYMKIRLPNKKARHSVTLKVFHILWAK